MFTGLVEALGRVDSVTEIGPGRRLEIEVGDDWSDAASLGDSVAVNGCCLTVVEIGTGLLAFEAGPETLKRTNLGQLALGSQVNLERPLSAGGRLGGHFVQGHVDDVGRVAEVTSDGEWVSMSFEVPESLLQQMVSKGSVAVDGVSLTVVNVLAAVFSVALIPHTLDVTTLGGRKVGETVNIETDILAKYVQRLAGGRGLDGIRLGEDAATEGQA